MNGIEEGGQRRGYQIVRERASVVWAVHDDVYKRERESTARWMKSYPSRKAGRVGSSSDIRMWSRLGA